jgi:hypothetical protein
MVGLSLRMAPHTTGYLHVQTNPKLSYSTQKTIKNAKSEQTNPENTLTTPPLLTPSRNRLPLQAAQPRLRHPPHLHQNPVHLGGPPSLPRAGEEGHRHARHDPLQPRADRPRSRRRLPLHCALRERAARALRLNVGPPLHALLHIHPPPLQKKNQISMTVLPN